MVVVKLIIRILLLPVRISLTIVQLVVMFITWLSATVFHILSGIICITAILGYGFGQETGTEMIRMLAVGFLLYKVCRGSAVACGVEDQLLQGQCHRLIIRLRLMLQTHFFQWGRK